MEAPSSTTLSEEAPSSTGLSNEKKIALLKIILADQNDSNRSDWLKVLMLVVPCSESNPTFKSRMLFASMADGFVFWKDVVCQLLIRRINTTASEIFPAIEMFKKLRYCIDYNIVCSVKAVAALLDQDILEITNSNEADVRNALKEFDEIDFTQLEW